MPGGSYAALSGMRARMEELDRLAVDLANVGTAGYKTERAAKEAAERTRFTELLDSAVDVAEAKHQTDFSQGSLATTGRDLDVALNGRGFFVVETPNGMRYTRNGSFSRSADGTLVTNDGSVVQGDSGPITLGKGVITVDEEGTIRAGAVVAGKLKVVELNEADALRESGARFMAAPGIEPDDVENPRVVGGALEQSNVSLVDRMAALTEVSRSFEALQKGVSVLYNDIDSRAIAELGRR